MVYVYVYVYSASFSLREKEASTTISCLADCRGGSGTWSLLPPGRVRAVEDGPVPGGVSVSLKEGWENVGLRDLLCRIPREKNEEGLCGLS